ncbi:glutamic-type intramembrane protease PrsW [Paenibacillus tarimensis]|uniref:glutamic-type intramembrane protease PrsW n=1 Tax=Paenibacillus tarimensis TaxID=416012 RepID=UPI001F3B1D0C|nr:glutamic-type intramembrane protease PrsW [Paenibacillus tarimensis]MCF2942515.1 glutamic-type intramembrane protease PrsW [Paenibacillus tarimensis]
MLLLSILAAAIAPGVSLLVYIYLKDRYDTEPFHMVARMFLVGVLIVLPIVIVQRGLMLWLGEEPFIYAYVISAGVEEVIKWFVLYHIIYNHTIFDEPYDGIIYASAISLGFATLENVLYALLMPSTFGSLLVRALLPVSAHALFGVMMGYYVGKAKFAEKQQTRRLLAFSLALPLFWHGLYDYIMLTAETTWIYFIIPLMIVLWIRGMAKIRRANAHSPFRIVGREDEVKM